MTDKAIFLSIYYQETASKSYHSYAWYAKYQNIFKTIGKKYGLTELFLENGII